MKPEVDLILAVMFTMPQNVNNMTIVHHNVDPLKCRVPPEISLFVNDSIAINHRGLVTCISKTATFLLVISEINN